MSPYIFKILQQKVTKQNLVLLVKRFIIVAVCAFLLFLGLNILFPLPDTIDYSTVVTDSKGEIINASLTTGQKWRMKTELNEISPLLRKTIIAKEDKYFYYHPGINPLAALRAATNNLLHLRRTSGASTITMQVARMLQPSKRTYVAKMVEMFRALQLEWKYNKEEILQMYLNRVPYGGNIEGVKAAAFLYFRKNPDHLSLAEITALSIIPNRPSSLVVGRSNGLIVKERNKWLQQFARDGVFKKKEIEDALLEPLTATRAAVPHYIPHLAYKLRKQSHGATIQSSIVLNTQLKIEKLTSDYIRALQAKNIHNAAVVVVDNQTHRVISYVGSAGFFDTSDAGQVNGAAAIRQPGSTLKPLLYGLCIDEGILTPKTVLTDVPVNFSGYAPENYDQSFHGFVTLEYALDHSLNIPAVKSLKELGKEKLISKLVSCDFSQIRKDQNKLGLSMILGGCGTSLEQLTGLFAAIANNGLYEPLRFTTGNSASKKVTVLSPAAAYMVTEMLSQVNRPDFPLNWQATQDLPKISWKTGTSYGRRDAWSIGYNKKYTVGVWVGNFSGEGVAELSGANTATPLLFKVFNTIDYNSNANWFATPDDCRLRQVCSETGLPPGPYCTNLISDYYIPLISSTAVCQHMQLVKVAADNSVSYCESCAPATGYIKKMFRILPPEMQEYYDRNGIAYTKLPPHNPECEKIFKGNGPEIISPVNGTEYYINTKDPEPLQLAARAGADVSRLYWYINDQFFKTSAPGEKQFFVPAEGPVKISCTDDKGRNRNIRVMVKHVGL